MAPRPTQLIVLCLLLLSIMSPASGRRRRCKRLQIQNGRASIRTRGTLSLFSCRSGYTLLGAKGAMCVEAKWNKPPPICIGSGCAPVRPSTNLQVTESYNGAMLAFRCRTGTRRIGPETVTCDGKDWSEPLPTCTDGIQKSCDFEVATDCDWSQSTFDQFDWSRNSGPTGTEGTGPMNDHTHGSAGNGHYLYIESSSPRETSDSARLVSPTYPATLTNMCLEFWYHMHGSAGENDVGSLQVFIKPETSGEDDLDPVFNVNGNQGDTWHRGLIAIPRQDYEYQLIIAGTKGNSHKSDIAIDDLRLLNCSDISTQAPIHETKKATTTQVMTSTGHLAGSTSTKPSTRTADMSTVKTSSATTATSSVVVSMGTSPIATLTKQDEITKQTTEMTKAFGTVVSALSTHAQESTTSSRNFDDVHHNAGTAASTMTDGEGDRHKLFLGLAIGLPVATVVVMAVVIVLVFVGHRREVKTDEEMIRLGIKGTEEQ